ncbi:epocide hydrolase domain-containing protein [Catenaria anguillulae PL171]|uniref:Epocide hydrolase domain-containing protein n=1 Tax=Catenaria anguillulae PL171 TaxID=765915 RepID=A0A1Y2HZ59_9FUNG|nr:epocide hydrolase domain-containing protein [Catenaria anguillulae PL171]
MADPVSAAANPNAGGDHPILPFTFRPTQDQIADLRARLAATRWPDQLQGMSHPWAYGTDRTTLQALCNYWANGYDFDRHFDAIMTAYPHFTTTVVGVPLHFIHVRSPRADAKPMLLIHGWPGSFMEFLDVIPLLSNPKDATKPAFHLVIPSLPGYVFSPAPTKVGFGTADMGRVFNHLMLKLGYIRYLAQGGDWGSFICRELAINHPHNCVGIHVNMVAVAPPVTSVGWLPSLAAVWAGKGEWVLSKEENEWVKQTFEFLNKHTAYQHIQAESPQTLAYALNDSPAGLASWLLEKFYLWSHHQGDITLAIPLDKILTNISLYWFTACIASSIRLYKEHLVIKWDGGIGESQLMKAKVPPSVVVGVANFPKEILKMPKAWVRHYMNVQHWSVLTRGGHFAALEEPELLAEDVQTCVKGWIERKLINLD